MGTQETSAVYLFYGGFEMTTENNPNNNVRNYIKIVGILIKEFIVFWLIGALTTGIRFTDSILEQAFHAALFIFAIYTYIRWSMKKQGITLEECRITKFRCSVPDILRAIGIPLIISIGILIVAGGIRPTGIDLKDLAYLLLLGFIRSSVASGVTEELFFRGYLFKYIERKSNWKTAIFFSSLLFGLAHIIGTTSFIQSLLTFLGTASLGVLFAVMTYQHGTIWPSVFVHMVMNSKERLIGFDKSSSLFVFDFINIPVQTQLLICWGIVFIISTITTLIYLRKSRKTEKPMYIFPQL